MIQKSDFHTAISEIHTHTHRVTNQDTVSLIVIGVYRSGDVVGSWSPGRVATGTVHVGLCGILPQESSLSLLAIDTLILWRLEAA